MFCLYNNIYICGINEVPVFNLNNFNYIVNCTNNNYNTILNITQNSTNYATIDLSYFNLFVLNNFYSFVQSINSNTKILLVDENGISNASIVGIFLLMKLHNSKFSNIYNSLKLTVNLNTYFYYNNLVIYEQQIINKNTTNQNIPMEIGH
jgi:hypothetical protein